LHAMQALSQLSYTPTISLLFPLHLAMLSANQQASNYRTFFSDFEVSAK
jgi:hypothetical protein